MKKFDLLIQNGTIVDGKRTPKFKGDIGIIDGVIETIGKIHTNNAKEVIDAEGKIVAPGFVDLHTHYDSQVYWDPWCTMNSWHGITTVTIGNCGFGFAPCKPEDRDASMKTMERNEAIKFETMKEGMPWDWETHPEFMDSIERTPKGVNIGTFTPLGPIMMYVMGKEAAKSRKCNKKEIKEISRIIEESMEAGSLGISAQRLGENSIQRDSDGSPMITDRMDADDFVEFSKVLKKLGRGFIQVLGGDYDTNERLMESSGRPLIWNSLVTVADQHGLTFDSLWKTTEWIEKCNAEGKRVVGHAVTAPTDYQFQLADFNLLDGDPDWRKLFMGDVAEKMKNMADPALRQPLKDKFNPKHTFVGSMTQNLQHWRYGEGEVLEVHNKYEGRTIDEIAKTENKHPIDVLLDISISENLLSRWVTPPQKLDMEGMNKLANFEFSIPGLSDGGAHAKFLTMGCYPTYFLATLCRDHNMMSLEKAHWKLAAYPAQVAGIKDRGHITEGYAADIVVYDLEELEILPMEELHDFPANDWRLVQKPKGYKHIIVNGVVTFTENSECTGETPGHFLRHGMAKMPAVFARKEKVA
ncbi:amidohydrolase family protein [Gammaproteobacteria bacterium]|nr:amidohydrolase family protein [Gammaproteobacteria bacterium]